MNTTPDHVPPEWEIYGTHICSLCGVEFVGMGNNPEPLKDFEERCCDSCNWTKVIPARIAQRS